MLMGGSKIINETSIVSTDFVGKKVNYANDTLSCTTSSTVTITGTNVKLEDIKKIKYTIDGNPVYIYIENNVGGSLWEIVKKESNKITIKTRVGYYYRVSKVLQGDVGQDITFKGTTENIIQGTEVETYTSSYKLEEIDNLREYILKQGQKEMLIKGNSNAVS